MIIGLDFDNTIVSYDRLFHRVALDLDVIPSTVAPFKNAVRDHLRQAGIEDVWTEMQGVVYGSRMDEAEAFPGALNVIAAWIRSGHRVVIISHKTRHPFRGEKHDLHAAARHWLEINGFFDPAVVGMNPDDAFFELTKEEKLARVRQEGCAYFVDDLPEILGHPMFPDEVGRILFDPADQAGEAGDWPRASNWSQVSSLVSS